MPHFPKPYFAATVVDGQPQDYRHLVKEFSPSIQFTFYPTGAAILRAPQRRFVSLWIVNTRLSDMSGFDLAEMLELDRYQSTLLFVSNHYQVEDERLALRYGATRYLCKPPQKAWLTSWLESKTRRACELTSSTHGKETQSHPP